ncbi:MAG: acyltransferase family protein [Methylocystis silviterrae]|uniref:acyltransferase family protein n=1 Tax=Methylocystis silviterrae TaxID=2743612 RepID=UPI003C7198B4
MVRFLRLARRGDVFVISGFVIPYSLYGADYRVAQFPRFMLRRFLRIEPPYLVSILLAVMLWHMSAAAPGFHGLPPQYSFWQIVAHLFYMVPFTNFGWLNVVYWSLFFEFLFYISVGLAFPLIARQSIAAIVALFAAILWGCSYFTEPPAIILLFLIGIAGFRRHVEIDSQPVFYATILGAALGRVDEFDQAETSGETDDRSEISGGLLAA